MKVSIIIPVHKVEKYIRKCLDSVISQSYKDLEIILVNDGSPDTCGEICDEYSQIDSRIKVIHKDNEGLSEARNSGMKVATGDYIYFLDSDDFICNDAINLLQQRALKTDADIVIGNYMIINSENKIYKRNSFERENLNKELLKSSSERFKYFFGESYGTNAWNKLYKTKFLRPLNIKFEKNSLIYAEDILFNIKLFINEPKIELVNEFTYFYFQNTNSITKSYKKELAERYLNLLESLYKYLRAKNILNDYKDLIDYMVFTAIDTTCLNSYEYSAKNKYKNMKYELKKFKKSKIVNEGIVDLAKGKFLKEVPRKDWKYYSWVLSVVYNFNLIDIATFLQILRFKVKRK